jgi:ATP-dependent protease ClpP protease subunit
MAHPTSPSQRFRGWLSGHPEETALRWIFRTALATTFAVLALDLATLNGWIDRDELALTPAESSPTLSLPSIPAVLTPWLPRSDRQLAPMPQADGVLGRPISFELVGGGRLLATGTITPGSAEVFAAEIAKRGDYVTTVVLNSPGGSVGDALAMGRLIRERKLATEVEAGKYCASSCPLMFAGGVERRAGAKAAIGVHQVFAMAQANAPRDQMSDAQRITARCQRYLAEMGIDLQVWVHAMETPKDRLFVFTPEELKSFKLVTASSSSPAPQAVTAPISSKSKS